MRQGETWTLNMISWLREGLVLVAVTVRRWVPLVPIWAVICMVTCSVPPLGCGIVVEGVNVIVRPGGSSVLVSAMLLLKSPIEVMVKGMLVLDPCASMIWLTDAVNVKSRGTSVSTKIGACVGWTGWPPADWPVMVIGYEPAGVFASVCTCSVEVKVGSPLVTVKE